MKTILFLLLLPVLAHGADSTPAAAIAPGGQQAEQHPSSYVGRWVSKFQEKPTDFGYTLTTLILNGDGSGTLRSEIFRTSGEIVRGTWARIGDFLIIDGLDYHLGFAAFKVTSESDTRLTLVDHLGNTREFRKLVHPVVNSGPPQVGSPESKP
jgi:hypothetical protein